MKKTYVDVITLLEASGSHRLHVTAHYANGRYEWLPVDKIQYLQQLKAISNPESVEYPCWFEVEPDGEMFIHTKAENPIEVTHVEGDAVIDSKGNVWHAA